MTIPWRDSFISILLVSGTLIQSLPCCGDDDKESPSGQNVSPSDRAFQQALEEHLTSSAKEASTFAKAVSEVVHIPNPEVWQGIVDWHALLDLAFTGIEVHERSKREFRQGFLSSLNTPNGFFGQVHQSLGEFGSYELVRVHKVDGRQRALFRLITNDGGINYHDYLLFRDDQGRPRAIDVYIYLTGESLTTTIRRMIRQIAAEQKHGFLDRLAGRQEGVLKSFQTLDQMTQHIHRGDADGALKIYDSLSRELRQNKTILILRYTAATMLSDEKRMAREIAATVEIFRDAYPQDACLDFMALDYHLTRKEYDKTLQAVDRLDNVIGGDPFLQEMRGNIHYQAGQIDQAVRHFEFAIATLPLRESSYMSLIGIAIEQKDHAATLAGLKRLDQAIVMEWADFREVPEYAGFVASPYFEKWTEYLKSKPVP